MTVNCAFLNQNLAFQNHFLRFFIISPTFLEELEKISFAFKKLNKQLVNMNFYFTWFKRDFFVV